MSDEKKVKEVVERLQRLAAKQKEIDARMKRVEKAMESKEPEE